MKNLRRFVGVSKDTVLIPKRPSYLDQADQLGELKKP